MNAWVLADSVGRIVWQFIGGTLAEAEASLALSPVPSGALIAAPSTVRGETHWRDGGAWALRPVPPAPPALVAGVAATWAGLPVGAVMSIVDPISGQTAEDTDGNPAQYAVDQTRAITFTLPAGPWRLSVAEAFPAVAASFDIKVATE